MKTVQKNIASMLSYYRNEKSKSWCMLYFSLSVRFHPNSCIQNLFNFMNFFKNVNFQKCHHITAINLLVTFITTGIEYVNTG